jgi:hypothetical protein
LHPKFNQILKNGNIQGNDAGVTSLITTAIAGKNKIRTPDQVRLPVNKIEGKGYHGNEGGDSIVK